MALYGQIVRHNLNIIWAFTLTIEWWIVESKSFRKKQKAILIKT